MAAILLEEFAYNLDSWGEQDYHQEGDNTVFTACQDANAGAG